MISGEAAYRIWLDQVRRSAPLGDARLAREMRGLLRLCRNDLDRRLLRMRYLEGRTLPAIVAAMERQGKYYTQRHVERLLRRAEQNAFPAWQGIRAGRRGEPAGPQFDVYLSWQDEPACVGCRYYRPIHSHGGGRMAGRVCHYLLDTGSMRACPFGAECTRYQPD